MHPHSGIATLTWQPGRDVKYKDTTGKNGILKAGGLEWMNAGGGAWHQGEILGTGEATGFQLWVPMPPGVENGAPFGQYVSPDEVPIVPIEGGHIRVLLGDFNGFQSPIQSHQDMNYWVLDLEAHSRFTFTPPVDHDVGFAYGFVGSPEIQGQDFAHRLAVFSREKGNIEIVAPKDRVQVLIGTAKRHSYPLFLGPSSVHTTADNLRAGLSQIQALRPFAMQS